jgi:hypothetical protein
MEGCDVSEVMFSKNGTPLIAYGKSGLIVTKGANIEKKADHTKVKLDNTISFGKYKIALWGDANNFPQTANTTIGKTGVLNTGLKFIRNFTLGQGIFPCKIKGFDDDGNELLEIINDTELRKFVNGRVVRRYLETALRDYLKFGPAFPQLIFNGSGDKIVGLNTINALHGRYTEANNGYIEKLIVSGNWPDGPETDKFESYDVLDTYDPFADLDRRRIGKELKGQSFIYPLKDSWSNNDYYSEPLWLPAYNAGWIDVAHKVPNFLKKAYENQITWKWHVQIPYSYWDKKYPETEYKTTAERIAAIQLEMDSIEENLCGTENANKALFTFFSVNEANGKAEEQWIIEPLDNKYKEGDKLITSAAANSEILFSLMLNPNVMGAGMPGGVYSGNQGGSNVREAFLVNVANAWLDRQNVLDPIECMLEFNGVKDIELRFRNTILTTLDTGAGTEKKLS